MFIVCFQFCNFCPFFLYKRLWTMYICYCWLYDSFCAKCSLLSYYCFLTSIIIINFLFFMLWFFVHSLCDYMFLMIFWLIYLFSLESILQQMIHLLKKQVKNWLRVSNIYFPMRLVSFLDDTSLFPYAFSGAVLMCLCVWEIDCDL